VCERESVFVSVWGGERERERKRERERERVSIYRTHTHSYPSIHLRKVMRCLLQKKGGWGGRVGEGFGRGALDLSIARTLLYYFFLFFIARTRLYYFFVRKCVYLSRAHTLSLLFCSIIFFYKKQ